MKTHVSGQPTLGELRQHVLAALLGNPLFGEAEQVRANHFVHKCEDVACLLRWGASVQTEIARREAAAQIAAVYLRRQQALRDTLRQLCPPSFRRHALRCPTPAWLASCPAPDQTDHRAGAFDRRAAARFQPADSLTRAHLLNHQAR